MKLINIYNARTVIETLADCKDISFSTAYWMAKFIERTHADNEFFVSEMSKLLGKYAETDENGEYVTDGTNIKLKPDCVEEFNRRSEELQNTEVDDPNIRFKYSQLEDIKLSMKQIYPLMPFIDEDE